ncbi:serine hydrolase domain-containing protein [Amycolatopsis magusensis]|uniref:D-alanyl-D-alanine carboxypeptidase n=1 Tax=Amycolatopsis magusensis TaxID=882444 RepID=A0ABS4PT29_9PSEU|nr:serine hydrolase domain-containing protein [Amycolatopsis magusensis]MBP2182577.1 D-alanyl-D-alanine carboxypeptidase [Amycolatopsis magusensis]
MKAKAALTALVLSAGVVLVAPASAQDHAVTQAAVNTYRASNGAPGAAAVVREQAGMWGVTSGTTALGQNRPFGAGDRIRAGSLTKPFTAAIVLQLVAEGHVDLDASVETYLPGVVRGNGYDGDLISVRQLLNHTSGVNEYLWLGGGINPIEHLRPHTLAEVAGWGLAQPPLFAPGAGQQYSNTNFILAGMIIERVTGNSYDQELAGRITGPLGLTGTYLPTPGDKSLPPGHVRGYVGRFLYVDFTELIEPSVGLSGGGLVTTGADATRFFQALMAGEVVPPAQLAEMLEPAAGGPVNGYGLGLERFPLPCGGEAWGHYGLWPGYQSVAAATTDGRSAFVAANVINNIGGESDSVGGGNSVHRGVTVTTVLCDQG